ncbi:MAG: phage tail protein [Prevotellaceae bacterium]|nr:phage tail protein [Prevotellaceae bacterium]
MAIKGKLLMVTIVTDNGKDQAFQYNTDKTIAYATSHTLDLSSSLDSVQTKDDNELFKEQEVTSQDWSVKTENLIAADPDDPGTPTYSTLHDFMKNSTKVYLSMGYLPYAAGKERDDYGSDWLAPHGSQDQENVPEGMVYGWAYITSLELNAENKSNVSYSATFQGAGKILSGRVG